MFHTVSAWCFRRLTDQVINSSSSVSPFWMAAICCGRKGSSIARPLPLDGPISFPCPLFRLSVMCTGHSGAFFSKERFLVDSSVGASPSEDEKFTGKNQAELKDQYLCVLLIEMKRIQLHELSSSISYHPGSPSSGRPYRKPVLWRFRRVSHAPGDAEVGQRQ